MISFQFNLTAFFVHLKIFSGDACELTPHFLKFRYFFNSDIILDCSRVPDRNNSDV